MPNCPALNTPRASVQILDKKILKLMLFMTNICQALMDSGDGGLKYLLQLRSFSTRVNATDEGGVASEKQNSLSTMTIILNKH